MPKIDPNILIAAIRDADLEPRSYSGRGMYGANCVGVDLDRDGDLFKLGLELGQRIEDVPELEFLPAPKTDNMGRGIIAYWPSIRLADDHPLLTAEAESDDDYDYEDEDGAWSRPPAP